MNKKEYEVKLMELYDKAIEAIEFVLALDILKEARNLGLTKKESENE